MGTAHLASVLDEPVLAPRFRVLASAGFVLALLFAAISLAGLLLPATYERESESWTEQAIAQDWFDLVIGVPMLVLTAVWAGRGTRRGLVVYAGTLLFAIYTATIYAFAVHLNAVFLVYCAALGVGIYTLIGTCARLWQLRSGIETSPALPRRAAGAFLVGVGVAFALLWLAQLVPAAIDGTVPVELAATGLVTNPVHVIDLSFILPLHVIAGVCLWRMRSPLALLGPIVLVFGALMSASIGVLTAFAGNAPITIAMAVIALASTVLAALVMRALR